MIKQNMRYRGPMESKKVNRFYCEVEQNLLYIKEELENIQSKIKEYNKEIDLFIQYEKTLDAMEKNMTYAGGFLYD
ncbi:MAG: hypothetical protein N2043_02045 [Ignavibacterium sp.]|nr:hypothetical protein [Ignavibacterium sp.]